MSGSSEGLVGPEALVDKFVERPKWRTVEIPTKSSPLVRFVGAHDFIKIDGEQRGQVAAPDQLGQVDTHRLVVPQRAWTVVGLEDARPSLGLCQVLDRACLSRFRLLLT